MKTVNVTFENKDSITTDINGTIKEIEYYYAIGKPFNLGPVEDNITKVESIEFLEAV